MGSTPEGELIHPRGPPSALDIQKTIIIIMSQGIMVPRILGVTIVTWVMTILDTVNKEMVIIMVVASVYRGTVDVIVVLQRKSGMVWHWTSLGSTRRRELIHPSGPPSVFGIQKTIAVIMNRGFKVPRIPRRRRELTDLRSEKRKVLKAQQVQRGAVVFGHFVDRTLGQARLLFPGRGRVDLEGGAAATARFQGA